MRQQELIRAALEGKATFVIKNANVVNVFTNEILRADVALYHDVIVGVGKYSCENEYDAGGAYLTPGFIDAHVHIESSMVIPSSFMKVIMPFGTTTIIADPHEIANVCGVPGFRAMYKLTDDLPLRVLFMMPSCVPATPFERSGAKLVAEDMEQFLHKSRVLGLGEVMDYVSVVGAEQEMLDKLRLFDGKPIDGHAPLLSGNALNAYRAAGPATDHECSNFDEIMEKLRAGMRVMIRIGSAANDMQEILRRVVKEKLPTENLMFCTDDKHIEDIRREGHINCNARLAVQCGMPPVEAVKMASWNAARAYNIRQLGAIAPGYKADMALFEDLEEFRVKQVFTRFGAPYDPAAPLPTPILPPQVFESVHIRPVTTAMLELRCREEAPVIQMIEHQLMTRLARRKVPRDAEGRFTPGDGLVKLAVVERHHATGGMAVGILEGLGIRNGAVASTVAHDSHNLVVAGDNDRDMLTAIESLHECGGGYCVVSRGVVLSRLPLPIAGLMTDAPVDSVLEIQRALLEAAHFLGAKQDSDPLIALSFLALPVIPEARLTDRGLFDVTKMRFVPYE
ncbi:MAG: Adenine deaminase [Firmicutes bacterium ADurb.Bin248]|nr:MAG: Adenine deaminase [Firmicutes bacterium ADurb.Bin248]HOG01946.1 adenine deaminase [Clostridia bacterium]